MTTEYTKTESAVIRSAYDQLAYIAETTDCSAPLRLREALAYEKRGRSSLIVAKALMLSEAVEGFRPEGSGDGFKPALPSALYRLSSGLALAHIFGADIGRRYAESGNHADQTGASRFRDRVRGFIATAGLALQAHEAQQGRRRAAVMTEANWK